MIIVIDNLTVSTQINALVLACRSCGPHHNTVTTLLWNGRIYRLLNTGFKYLKEYKKRKRCVCAPVKEYVEKREPEPQGSLLQSRVSEAPSILQGKPPFCALCSSFLCRLCTPMPQGFVQGVQGPKVDHWQSSFLELWIRCCCSRGVLSSSSSV